MRDPASTIDGGCGVAGKAPSAFIGRGSAPLFA